jgi:hypothetical protein
MYVFIYGSTGNWSQGLVLAISAASAMPAAPNIVLKQLDQNTKIFLPKILKIQTCRILQYRYTL